MCFISVSKFRCKLKFFLLLLSEQYMLLFNCVYVCSNVGLAAAYNCITTLVISDGVHDSFIIMTIGLNSMQIDNTALVWL